MPAETHSHRAPLDRERGFIASDRVPQRLSHVGVFLDRYADDQGRRGMDPVLAVDLMAELRQGLPARPLLRPVDQAVAAAHVRRQVADCLAHLSEREAWIVRQRYGLGTDEPQTLQEIGDHLGVSRERVRQLEKQALTKLRQGRHLAMLEELAQ